MHGSNWNLRKMSHGTQIETWDVAILLQVILTYTCYLSEEENFTLKMGTVMYIETQETVSTHDTMALVHKIVSNE